MKEFKTTEKHFKVFVRECKKWINKFGLLGWEINYVHEDLDPKARATCTADLDGRLVLLNLSVSLDLDPTDVAIKRVAFHEVMEVFLSQIVDIAYSRFVNEHEIEQETHNIIRTLEHVVFDASIKRKKKQNTR